MRHVDFILIILKLYLESKGVVETTSFFLQGILEVADILSVSVPANALAVVTISHLL
jgi:hypothetical protein